MRTPYALGILFLLAAFSGTVWSQPVTIEVSSDGHETAVVHKEATDGMAFSRGGVPYGTAPDWVNTVRMQVGGLQAVDVNNDGGVDVVVGCYHSQSYPPYDDWENMIYFNVGGQLETVASWISTDEKSTTDVQVADFNMDGFPDVFAANGDFSMDPSVIYFGGPTGPSTTPTWMTGLSPRAWAVGSAAFDIDHDGDIDLVTCNQGNSPDDPYRPIYIFYNYDGMLSALPGWQSAEISIQNSVAFADYDGNGWEDMAIAKWSNFQTGIYRNSGGTLQTVPFWTVGNTDSEKGIGWADVDGNGWPDLAVGRSPTRLYTNEDGVLTPTWEAVGSYFGHSELRFCDVDRDGDPDLAEVHFSNGKVQIYQNNDGVLDASPTWIYDSPSVGTAIAFGDVNGNHWPDLVCGFSGEPCVVVFYNAGPDCQGDLNGDDTINISDLATLLGSYGTQTTNYYAGELTGDGWINLADLAELLSLYGTNCEP